MENAFAEGESVVCQKLTPIAPKHDAYEGEVVVRQCLVVVVVPTGGVYRGRGAFFLFSVPATKAEHVDLELRIEN